mmetsp:Transcript_16409/g.31480  ORF Transcript_16409/g.31480 Transcript_16409/m.31480 type:complete len:223 (-) Transcript_16409:1626-2294(-)
MLLRSCSKMSLWSVVGGACRAWSGGSWPGAAHVLLLERAVGGGSVGRGLVRGGRGRARGARRTLQMPVHAALHHLQLLLVAAAAAGAATGVVWGSCRSSARVAGALGLCGMLPGGPVAHPKLAVHARLDTRKVGLAADGKALGLSLEERAVQRALCPLVRLLRLRGVCGHRHVARLVTPRRADVDVRLAPRPQGGLGLRCRLRWLAPLPPRFAATCRAAPPL